MPVPDPAAPPVKVLYILGWGRSGTTILDNLLGSVEGFFSTGELHYLWERGLVERRPCGCGQPLDRCPVWSVILTHAFGGAGPARELAPAVMRCKEAAIRVRHTWDLLRRERRPAPSAVLRCLEIASRLYRSVAAVTGARVVVDSSKRPSDAAALPLLDGVDAYFLHMVRDPRAVAYSWDRRRAAVDRPQELERHSAWRSTAYWVTWNAAADAVRRRHPDRSLLLRYEDFVRRPLPALRRILSLVDERPGSLPLGEDGVAELAPNHTVAGNPGRFSRGSVRIRGDEEWRRSQSVLDRAVATGLSLPLLPRFGYPILPAADG